MVAVCIIPARMGSERVPRKNLREIEPGMTLVDQAIRCAVGSGRFRDIVLTSDDDTILDHIGDGPTVFLRQPPEISGPQSDISSVVQWAMQRLEPADYVAVLQPAVLARSPAIVSCCVQAMEDHRLGGVVTMARSHPWVWTESPRGWGHCAWDYDFYPRSQSMPPTFCEINAVQVTTWAHASAGHRWRAPLGVVELPAWASVLDIDTEYDLFQAQTVWPIVRDMLAEHKPRVHVWRDVTCE